MKKRLISLMCAFAMLLGMVPTARAAGDDVQLKLELEGNAKLEAGDTVEVSLSLAEDSPDLTSVEVSLAFDTDAFSCIGVAHGIGDEFYSGSHGTWAGWEYLLVSSAQDANNNGWAAVTGSEYRDINETLTTNVLEAGTKLLTLTLEVKDNFYGKSSVAMATVADFNDDKREPADFLNGDTKYTYNTPTAVDLYIQDNSDVVYKNGNYEGSGTEAKPYVMTYDGDPLLFADTVDHDVDITITPDIAYTYAWAGMESDETPVDAGKYTLTVTPVDSNTYPQTATVYFEIQAEELSVSVSNVPAKTFDGTTDTTGDLDLSGVVDGDTVSVTGDIAWASADAGEDELTVSNLVLGGDDADNYTIDETITVAAGKSIQGKTITTAMFTVDDGEQEYEGSPVTVDVTADTGVTYTTSYEDNEAAGTATLTIEGTGNYGGSLSYTFDIYQMITATFTDEDGETIGSQNLKMTSAEGIAPTKPTEPTKPSTSEESYAFVGWKEGENTYTGNLPAITEDTTFQTVFTVSDRFETVTVVFKNYDNIQLETQDVIVYEDDEGDLIATSVIYGGDAPTRATDDDNVYHFSGWDKALSVTADTTFIAQFTAVPRHEDVTVTFENHDGAKLETQIITITDGVAETVTYGGATPTKGNDDVYAYTFSGWKLGEEIFTGELPTIVEDTTFTAQFTAANRHEDVTVTFKNHDGEVLEIQTVTVTDGQPTTVTFSGATTPTKADTMEGVHTLYKYTFLDWGKELSVTADTTFTAQFQSEAKFEDVTVTFNNYDDTLLETQTVRVYGENPSQVMFRGTTPTKEEDAIHSYIFSGWGQELEVTTDTTFTAVFTQAVKPVYYSVTFLDEEDGDVLQTVEVLNGQKAVYTGAIPAKAMDETHTFRFAGWSQSVEAVTSPMTVWPTFTGASRQYTITWIFDGQIYDTTQQPYGAAITKPTETPSLAGTDQYSYTFAGWFDQEEDGTQLNNETVSGDQCYYAQFTQVTKSYDITWQVEGQPDKTDTLMYGAKLAVDEPKVEGKTFLGWKDAQNVIHLKDQLPDVTENATYVAVFEETEVKYFTVTFKDDNGSILASSKVQEGEHPERPTNPTKNDDMQWIYAFASWKNGNSAYDGNLPVVTADTIYVANYTKTAQTYEISYLVKGVTETATLAYGAKHNPATPENYQDEDGQYQYTFVGWRSGEAIYETTAKLPAVTGEVRYRAEFEKTPAEYTVTVNYGNVATAKTETVAYGEIFTIPSPAVEGYTANATEVKGRMGTENQNFSVTYYPNTYEGTVKYQDTKGQVIATHTFDYVYGQAHTLTLPELTGYTKPQNTAEISSTNAETEELSYVVTGYTPAMMQLSATWINPLNGTRETSAVTMAVGSSKAEIERALEVVKGTIEANDGLKFVGWMCLPETMPNQNTTVLADVDISTEGWADIFNLKYHVKLGDGQALNVLNLLSKTKMPEDFSEATIIRMIEAAYPQYNFRGIFEDLQPSLARMSLVCFNGPTTYQAPTSQEVSRVLTGTPKVYTLTIERTGDITENKTFNFFYGETINMDMSRQGYTPSISRVEGTMTGNTTVTVDYTKNSYNLMVNYEYADGTIAGNSDVQSVVYGIAPASVTAPSIDGYIPSNLELPDTMPAKDMVYTVVYTAEETPSLTILYKYEDGTTAATSYVSDLAVGQDYEVTAPTIERFTPDVAVVEGTISGHEIITVTYFPTIYTVTIQYKVPQQETTELILNGEYGQPYSVTTPAKADLEADKDIVSGKFGVGDSSIVVTYTSDDAGAGGGGLGGGGGMGGGEVLPEETVEGEQLGDLYGSVLAEDGYVQINADQQQAEESVLAVLGGTFTVDVSHLEGTKTVSLPETLVNTLADSADIHRLVLKTDGFTMVMETKDLCKKNSGDLIVDIQILDKEKLSQTHIQYMHNDPLGQIYSVAVAYLDGETVTGVDNLQGQLTLHGQEITGDHWVATAIRPTGTATYNRVTISNGSITFPASFSGVYAIEPCHVTGFTDVNLNDWYHLSAEYVVEHGLMKGISQDAFAPYQSVTRAMVVTTLWRMAGEPEAEGQYFDDVTADWSREAINWAAETGVTKGITENTFEPDTTVTREQFATFLYRYAEKIGQDVSNDETLAGYTDQEAVSDFAREAMEWSVEQGLIQGKTTTTLDPQGLATRAELATILARFCNNVLGTNPSLDNIQ